MVVLAESGGEPEDPRSLAYATDLAYFHRFARLSPWESGRFTRLAVLRKAIYGSVELHSVGGERRVVKSLGTRAMRAPHCLEDALTEVGVHCLLAGLGSARSPHLLACFGGFEDAAGLTRLVLEEAQGGELFEAVARGDTLDAAALLRQLLQALRCLHRHGIGHRDVSLENVLLTQAGEVRLSDFGQAVQSRGARGQALRYFGRAGKDLYRAPECYVPLATHVSVPPASSKSPAAPADDGRPVAFLELPGGLLCEVWVPKFEASELELAGYEVPAADLFACGVCLFLLCFAQPPWRCAALADPFFAEVHRRGTQALADYVRVSLGQAPAAEPAMELLWGMLRSDPAQRWTLDACLASSWLARKAPVEELVNFDYLVNDDLFESPRDMQNLHSSAPDPEKGPLWRMVVQPEV